VVNDLTASGPAIIVAANGEPVAAMMGKLSSGNIFFLGSEQWNYAPPGQGQLSFIFNSAGVMPDGSIDPGERWQGTSGLMTVRVIITR
jgi:hypothetical protein